MPSKTTSSPVVSAKYQIRAYDPQRGDREAILNVFNLVFGQQRTVRHWQWKYEQNPYGQIAATVACDGQTNQVVAHYTAIPMQWNVKGEAQLGCQSVDTLVHPDHRRQGLFEATAEDFFARAEAKKMVGVFGFPSEAAYPGFTRRLGWQRVAVMQRYTLRLNLFPELRSALKISGLAWPIARIHRVVVSVRRRLRAWDLRRRLGTSVEYRESDTVPAAYEALWQAAKSFEVFSIWKDEKYFQWRYDRHPDRKYRYAYLEKNGRVLALAVVNQDSASAQICELVTADRNVLTARYLLARLASASQARGMWRLVFQGRDLGFFDEAFANFEKLGVYNFLFCGKVFSAGNEHRESFALADNWTVTQGDSDHV